MGGGDGGEGELGAAGDGGSAEGEVEDTLGRIGERAVDSVAKLRKSDRFKNQMVSETIVDGARLVFLGGVGGMRCGCRLMYGEGWEEDWGVMCEGGVGVALYARAACLFVCSLARLLSRMLACLLACLLAVYRCPCHWLWRPYSGTIYR